MSCFKAYITKGVKVLLDKIINTKNIKIYIACILGWSLLGGIYFYNVDVLRNCFIFMGSLSATYLFRMRKITRELNSTEKTRAYIMLAIIGILSTVTFIISLYN